MQRYPFLLACALVLLPIAAPADEIDSLFDDPGSGVIEEAAVIENPEASILETASFLWAGDFTGSIGVESGCADLAPSLSGFADSGNRLAVDIGTRLWFDARPDRNFRVFAKFTADYPFASGALDDGGDGTVSVNSIRIFEAFSDFNLGEKVFFRFGKQTAGWGLSRFYQIADPLSVGVKDPGDPSADLEGPVALKASLPVGVNTFYAYAVMKDSYLPENIAEAGPEDLGLGAKADILVPVPKNPVIGNGELTLGAYWQRKLAPKAIAGFSTGVGDVQVFTDHVVSWGLDSARLAGSEELPGICATEKADRGLFWSATLGAMYVNNDRHFTGYGEYLFSGPGSTDPDYLGKWADRLGAEKDASNALEPTLVSGDIAGYLSRHNTAVSLAWSEILGTDKLSFSVLWMQNWIDRSGMLSPELTFEPNDHFGIETGLGLAWGDSSSEWVVKTSDFSSGSPDPRRFTVRLAVKLGCGKF